jgi:GxxExxY protein
MGITEPSDRLDLLARTVVDAAMEVHQALGPGFPEAVYEEALAVELELRGVSSHRQVPIAMTYKGFAIGEGRIDLLVDNALIVELKAVEHLLPVHTAQVLSYLQATRRSLALLYQLQRPVPKTWVEARHLQPMNVGWTMNRQGCQDRQGRQGGG